MVSALFVALALSGQVPAADADSEKVQQKKWNDYYAKVAADYEISRGEERKQKLELKPEAVLYWSNPVRGGETNGSVFVWIYEGRAELVGTIFSHLARSDPQQKMVAHSFQSLSHQPLAGERPGQPGAWSLAGAGVQPRPIPDAPAPAATPAGRLSQMRDLAREFTATTTLDGVEQELRLLTQPIYRQGKVPDKSDSPVLDSALFTFVTGTDPELMLVIEARPTESGSQPVWHYAAGRFTDLTLKLRHKKVELWTHEHGQPIEGRPDPYISGRYETRPRLME
jgi:hypothetical protein